VDVTTLVFNSVTLLVPVAAFVVSVRVSARQVQLSEGGNQLPVSRR
jgi:hypothetical protein